MLRYFKEYIKVDINLLRILTVMFMLIKSILFMAIIQRDEAKKIFLNNITIKYVLVQLAFILLIYSFGYLLRSKRQVKFNIGINMVFSILLIIDLSYYRISRDFIGLKNLFYPQSFNPMNMQLINFRYIDLIFIIDLIGIIAYCFLKKIKSNKGEEKKKFKIVISSSILVILISSVLFDGFAIDGNYRKIFQKRWDTLMSATVDGPLGYHLIEMGTTLYKVTNTISDRDKADVEEWLAYNDEDIKDDEYKGVLKGKNVILLQVESMEDFVLGKKVGDEEIMPFLTELSKKSLYCSNFYEQNWGGHSIDCDFMVNSSVFPLKDEITAVVYGENTYKNSLPRILDKYGYNTITNHAEELNSFNWSELHRCGFNSNKIWSINDFIYDEKVGYGLSDKSLFTQTAEKLKSEEQPFLMHIPTLSSHGPFDLPSYYRKLKLPKNIDESYLGGYFQSLRYTDDKIRDFFDMLNEEGLLKDTVFLIYGDHTGVHNYYNEDIQKLDYDGNWWKEYDHKISLIIYSEGIKAKEITASGGQVDILPTLCYLLGIDDEEYKGKTMGRILVNTNRDATVRKGNVIVGNVKNEKEKEFIEKSYYIGDKIIRKNYFKDR